MIIAFEGPDNVGKTYSAANIGHLVGEETYNMTKESHARISELMSNEKGLVHAFDRIDWMTHMIYRLALPGHEWNDERVRTVFAAPDTHLVFKMHHPGYIQMHDPEEGYGYGVPSSVNDMYRHMASYFMTLNEVRGYSLFKTVTIMEVTRDVLTGDFSQRVVDFSSPVYQWGTVASKLVDSDESLVEFLLHEESRRV